YSFFISYYYRLSFLFFFNHPATTETYTLSLHDALPICCRAGNFGVRGQAKRYPALARSARSSDTVKAPSSLRFAGALQRSRVSPDRKSTRLNSSHRTISYAVFCLKKKKHKSNRDINEKK